MFELIFQAAESGLVKIRNINSGSNEQNLLTNLRSASSELLQPLTLGCASKNARLVQISLQAIQKMIQYRVIEPVSICACCQLKLFCSCFKFTPMSDLILLNESWDPSSYGYRC